MPTFRVTLKDGRVFDVEADHQPTEDEVMAKINAGQQPSDVSLSIGGNKPPAPTQPTDTTPSIWERLNTPLWHFTPEAKQAMEQLPSPASATSFSDKVTNNLLSAGKTLAGGLEWGTSPLGAGLEAASFGAPIAESLGFPGVATALRGPGKVAGGIMIGKGLHDISQGDIGGGLTSLAMGGTGVAANVQPEIGITLRKAGATVPDVAPTPSPIQEPTPANQKFLNALKIAGAPELKKEWEAQLARQRAQRFSQLEQVQDPGYQGFQEKRQIMAGDYGKPTYPPLNLGQASLNMADLEALHREISTSSRLNTVEKFRAGMALMKAVQGHLLQDNEIDLLSRVWGPDFSQALSNMRTTNSFRPMSLLAQGIDATKSLVTAGHFSAPLRNAAFLIDRPQFWSAFNEMFQSFASQGNYDRIMTAIQTDPDFPLMQKYGAEFTKLSDTPTLREDQIRSRFAERIPVYGRYVKAGNRAFTAYLNTVRFSVLKDLLNYYSEMASKIDDPVTRMEMDPRANEDFGSQLAEFVNNATGRGSLGRWEKNAQGLNMWFMSPRMQAARIQMARQISSPNTNPMVRREAIKSVAALARVGLAINLLGMMGGAETSNNPTSADFGKVKIGDTRIDPWAGNQQYVVALVRNFPGVGGTTPTTGVNQGQFVRFGSRGAGTRFSSIADFVANHASPPVKMAYDLLNARTDKTGQSTFDMGKSTAGMVLPITIQQLYEIGKSDPELLPLAVPGSLGMSVQTYGGR